MRRTGCWSASISTPPRFIQNVRTQVRDLDFDRPPCLDASVTMDRAWKLMREQKISAIPVVNEDGTLYGMLSAGDIATFSLNTVGNPRVDSIPAVQPAERHRRAASWATAATWWTASAAPCPSPCPRTARTLLFDSGDGIVLCGSQPDMIRRALDKQVACLILCQTDVDPAWLENSGKHLRYLHTAGRQPRPPAHLSGHAHRAAPVPQRV